MSRICIPIPASTVIGVSSSSASSPATNVFRVDPTITALDGSTSGCLDFLVTSTGTYPLNICVFLPNLPTPATYQLVSGTDAQNLPFVVWPDDHNPSTNAKIWKQRM